ncbi:MAG: thrombospondin type 3 repeat-containing protein [Kofleriaceae bacterium]
MDFTLVFHADAALTDRNDIVDAAVGHDEDGDGIPDAVDPCPFIAGDRADRDGDGVGDACDPNPDTNTEQLVLFTPFTPDVPLPFLNDGLSQEADDLIGSDFAVEIDQPFATGRIVVGFEIRQREAGGGQHQLSVGPETTPFYFAELDDNVDDTFKNVDIVYADTAMGTYDSLGKVPLATDVHTGLGTFVFDANATTMMISVDAGWPGEGYTVSASVPGYVGAPTTRLQSNGLQIRLDYLAVIASH